ncbi:Transcription factor IIIB 60 kDa subunit [Cucumispora dikerogammari]|nr:Transcription factor IIIB 60 kDa subunit [Cucumispora dikerogammari]
MISFQSHDPLHLTPEILNASDSLQSSSEISSIHSVSSECELCNSSSLQTDDILGMTYCEDCGSLQEENSITSTLQFDKHEGVSSINGQIHRISDIVTKVNNSFVTVSNHFIKNTLKSICSPIGLGEDHALSALKWYKLSLQYNLSRGKSILYTLSACVYLVCRLEKSPHLLMDFSVLLRINVYKIGRIFTKLVKLFNLEISTMDPSQFIPRFCQHLELKDKRIINLSNRLVRRMQRDWIVTGRRPNGVCGAAILVASRVFGDPKDINEVAKVALISVVTIKKRLEEIKKTESASLTVKDFNEIWIEREADPPRLVFRKAKEIKEEKILTPSTYVDDINSNSFSTIKTETEDVEGSSDIEKYILNDEEVKQKTRIWNEMYEDYIKERKANHGVKVKTEKKKKRRVFTNLEDAFKDVVMERRISSKINYTALEEFLNEV